MKKEKTPKLNKKDLTGFTLLKSIYTRFTLLNNIYTRFTLLNNIYTRFTLLKSIYIGHEKTKRNKISFIVAILVIAVFGILGVGKVQAEMVFSYGFEDWGGSIATTPSYPIGSAYSSYCDEHAAITEVVQEYQGCSAHSGNYYILISHANASLNPPVPGITGGGAQPRMNFGIGQHAAGSNCGQDDSFDLADVNTGEFFVTFWAYTSDWTPVANTPDAKLKWVRFYYALGADQALWYITRNHHNVNEPRFRIDGSGDYINGGSEPSFADGSWHKFSLYCNYNTEVSAIWYDEENPTLDNAYLLREGYPFNASTRPDPIVIVGNWSAHNPTAPVFHGIDDIEIWDGLPTATPCSNYNNQTECEANGCNYCEGTCQTESCPITIRADVNQDSQINTTDAQLTLRNSLGLDMTSTNWQTSSTTGDVNCDLTSNSTDAMLIIRHSLGLSMVGSGWCEGN